MASYNYNLFLMATAERDLRKIDKQHLSRIDAAILSLADDPYPSGSSQTADQAWQARISANTSGKLSNYLHGR